MHMQPSLHSLNLIIPADSDVHSIQAARPYEPFDDRIIAFLDEMSKRLLAEPSSRAYPDVVTFAFWIRKGRMREYKKEYLAKHQGERRLGRGVVFHIAPSNVPINFAYSLVAGMLAGNVNIVKVPSKDFPQASLMCSMIDTMLHEARWEEIRQSLLLVKYDRSQNEWTDYFSSFCDVRVIWGGDETIEDVRRSAIPARSFDICFADRYSFCVINADELVKEQDITSVARGFYNDTYLFDQNACTAPHLVVWLGSEENKRKAKQLFWGAVQQITSIEYDLPAVMAVDKLMAFCREAIGSGQVKRELMSDNSVTRMSLDELPEDVVAMRSLGGYFNEYDAHSLDEIIPLVTRKFQTLAYYGIEKTELQDFIIEHRLVGIDRCVPIGKTLDFNLVWDGWDLIGALSRVVN